MYKIIGNDGKTYGPVSAETLREWIGQNRADRRTPVLREGATEWSYIGLMPELNTAATSTPPVMAPPKPVAPSTNGNNGFATAGFVCGLLSLTVCCCCYGFPFNLLGLIFSIIALAQMNGQAPKPSGWGLALAGLICSVISLLLALGLGIFSVLSSAPSGVKWHIGSM